MSYVYRVAGSWLISTRHDYAWMLRDMGICMNTFHKHKERSMWQVYLQNCSFLWLPLPVPGRYPVDLKHIEWLPILVMNEKQSQFCTSTQFTHEQLLIEDWNLFNLKGTCIIQYKMKGYSVDGLLLVLITT